MLFKTIASSALVALAMASPVHVKRDNTLDCLGGCHGAVLEPTDGSYLSKTFTFKYETNPNVTTLSVTPVLSFTGSAPDYHQWDPITVPEGSNTIEAQLTIPDDYYGSGSYYYLYGLDKITTGDDGKTDVTQSHNINVYIK